MSSNSHSFDIEEAILYGVEKAVILYNFRFWLKKNKANGTNVREKDGVYYHWTFNSAKALTELFPYFRLTSVKRWLNELEDDGVIISGVFNKIHFDRTKWYTMPEFVSIAQNGLSNNSDDPFITENGSDVQKTLINPIAQNGLSEGTKMGHQIAQNGPTIPDGNIYINRDIEKSPLNPLPTTPCNDLCRATPNKCYLHNKVGEYEKISDFKKIDDLDWAHRVWIHEKTNVHYEAIEELRAAYSQWLKDNHTKARKVKDLLAGFNAWVKRSKEWGTLPWLKQANGVPFPEGEFMNDTEVTVITGSGKGRVEHSITIKEFYDKEKKEIEEANKGVILSYGPLSTQNKTSSI